MSPGGQNGDCVLLNLKLLGLGSLPVIFVAVLSRRKQNSVYGPVTCIFTVCLEAAAYVAQVESVHSGLDEEGVVRRQAVLVLGLFVVRLVVEL